jgi:rubrerythrin
MRNESSVLEFAMAMEKEGKEFFSSAASRVKNANTREILMELAAWEEKHYQYLRSERDAVAATGSWLSAEPETGVMGPKDKADTVFGKRGEGRGPEPALPIGELTSDMAILRMAIFIEKDLMDFYVKTAATIEDAKGRQRFTSLAQWEGEHAAALDAQYQMLQKNLWADAGFSPF